MAKYRLDPNIAFWRELKKGADEFEVTKMQTPVGVCNRHYVFSKAKGGASFDAESACPPLDLDKEILRAVADKEARDDSEVQGLIAKGVKPVRIVYQDGGQNPIFSHRFAEVSRPDAIATAPTEIVLDDSPKAKPVALQIAAARRNVGDGLQKPEPVVVVAAVPPAPATPAPKASLRGTKPVLTASAKDAGKPVTVTGSVPATFEAAPSAYAKEEPKSATRSFFDRIMGNGGDAPAPAAAPTPSAAQASAPTTGTKPGPQASLLRKALPDSARSDVTRGLDPNAVALAPTND